MLSARLAPFIAMETAAVVAAGESTPNGDVSGVSDAVVTRGSGKGLGTLTTCGLEAAYYRAILKIVTWCTSI